MKSSPRKVFRTTAANGNDALARLSQDYSTSCSPDLQIPGLDGLGVIRHMVDNKLNTIGILNTATAR